MKSIRIVFILSGILILPFLSLAQDIDARSPKPMPSSHQQKKADVKKEKQKLKLEKAIEKGKKRHVKLQTKDTKKRMKKSKRKSGKWNDR